jgi:hypothetical protein
MFHSLEDALAYAAATAVTAPAPASAKRQLLGAAAAAAKRHFGGHPRDNISFYISGISYKNISGSSKKLGGFSCTDDIKCSNITMTDVHVSGGGSYDCKYAKVTQTDVSPAVKC